MRPLPVQQTRSVTMRTKTVDWLAVMLMSVASHVAAADPASLAGAWSLDERSSDDPVHELDPRNGGDGLGRRLVKSVNVFGIPVGSLPLPGDDEAEEEPLSPQQILGPLAYAFEATYRLRIAQGDAATEIRYGNASPTVYRTPSTFELGSGWTSKVEWRDGKLTIEHERAADGAHVSERYWVDARADELHWTVQLKKPKTGAVNVKRVFYRPPTTENAGVPLTAQLLP
jgi:hypothetical protein